jgi:hypothetical protein
MADLERDITELIRLFDGGPSPVFLVGGVGMAVRSGTFYRNHRDFDVALFDEDLVPVARHLEARGYGLAVQRLGGFLSPWHRVHFATPLDVARIEAEDPDRLKLRVMRLGSSRWRFARRRTDYFDLYLLGASSSGIALHGYDTTVPHRDFFPARRLNGSPNLLLPKISYKRYLPPIRPKQRIDFEAAGLQPSVA